MAILKIWDGVTEVEIPVEDPTLYLLLDGSRPMTGALDMGANAITNVGNVDGRDVSADGAVLDTAVLVDGSRAMTGDLDMALNDILDVDAIRDVFGNEQLVFSSAFFAVNYINITNAATGSGPILSAGGTDPDADLRLAAKGTGAIAVLGNLTVTGTVPGEVHVPLLAASTPATF